MEIKEIVSYFLNDESNILEVTFRTIADSDEVLRVDNIDYSISEEYGYVLESEDFGFYDDEFDDENNKLYHFTDDWETYWDSIYN